MWPRVLEPLDPLEAPGFPILSHLPRGEDTAVHGDVDARPVHLQGTDGAADIEFGIRCLEARRRWHS